MHPASCTPVVSFANTRHAPLCKSFSRIMKSTSPEFSGRNGEWDDCIECGRSSHCTSNQACYREHFLLHSEGREVKNGFGDFRVSFPNSIPLLEILLQNTFMNMQTMQWDVKYMEQSLIFTTFPCHCKSLVFVFIVRLLIKWIIVWDPWRTWAWWWFPCRWFAGSHRPVAHPIPSFSCSSLAPNPSSRKSVPIWKESIFEEAAKTFFRLFYPEESECRRHFCSHKTPPISHWKFEKLSEELKIFEE